MLLRFQLTDQAFALMLRGRFLNQDLCIPKPIVSDLDNPTYVDHLEFIGAEPLGVPILQAGNNKPLNLPVTLPFNVNTSIALSVPTLVLNRTVGVYTTTLSDLKAAGSNPPATKFFPLTLQLALSVDHTIVSIKGNPTPTDQLTISYYGNTLTDEEIEQQLKTTRSQLDDTLRLLLPPSTSQLDFSSAFTSLGGNSFQPNSVWSGIAASEDFSRVEMRVEFSDSDAQGVGDASSWSNFYNNQDAGNIVADQDWAFFLDKDLIIGIVNSLVAPAVQKPSSSFRLESGPTLSWNAWLPTVVVNFSGDVINACQCAWGDIDVSEDLSLDVVFSASDGWLQIDLHLSNSSNQLQLLCCELTASFLWPALGFTLTDHTVGGRLEYITGLAFPGLAVFVGGIYIATTKIPTIPAFSGFQTDPNDSSHAFGRVSVTANLKTEDDSFYLTFVAGNSDGLILGGTHTDNNRQPAIIQVTDQGFQWTGPSMNCSGETTGSLMAQAQIAITRAHGDLDFSLCAVKVTPESWQANTSIAESYHPYSVLVTISSQTYRPDGVNVLIQTTGGLRSISFKPMELLTSAQEESFRLAAEAWRLENCFKLVVPWSKYFTEFHTKWAVDPPESDAGKGEAQQVWVTVIGGFKTGDRVVFTGQNGETIQTAFANSSGTVRLNGISNTSKIGLMRLPAGKEGADKTSPSITQKQILLRSVGSIPLGEPVLAMQGLPGHFSSGLLIATRSGVRSFNLNARGSWSMSRAWLGQNLAGALSSNGRLMGWSASGEVTDLSSIFNSAPSPANAIQRLSSAGLGLNHAVIVGNELLVLNASSVRSLDSGFTLTMPSDLQSLSRVGNSFVVHTASGEYRLYSQARSDGFELSAIYQKRPWFEGSIRVGTWIVTLSDDHKSAVISTVIAQQTL